MPFFQDLHTDPSRPTFNPVYHARRDGSHLLQGDHTQSSSFSDEIMVKGLTEEGEGGALGSFPFCYLLLLLLLLLGAWSKTGL